MLKEERQSEGGQGQVLFDNGDERTKAFEESQYYSEVEDCLGAVIDHGRNPL